jgi:hypothetical protein
MLFALRDQWRLVVSFEQNSKYVDARTTYLESHFNGSTSLNARWHSTLDAFFSGECAVAEIGTGA